MMVGKPAGATLSAITAGFVHAQAQAAYTGICVKDAATCALDLCDDTRMAAPAPTAEVAAAEEGINDSSAQGASVSVALTMALLVVASAM
jgi:hypothetical protein